MRKKGLVTLAAAMALALTMCSCAGKDSSVTTEPAGGTSAQMQENTQKQGETQDLKACGEIVDEILKKVTDTHNNTRTVYGEETYDRYFDYLYKADIDKIDDGAFAYASEAYADEITVVHFKDEADAKAFKSRLSDRIERRKQDFNGYKPEEVNKLDNAQILVEGSYAVMAVADNAEGIIEAFKSILEEDK